MVWSSLRSWLKGHEGQKSSRRRQPVQRRTRLGVEAPARFRPRLEALEDRTLPSVSFAPAVNYAAGSTPRSVAVGDFNGDGKPDLAVANGNSANVSVLLGTGTGTFQSAVNYAAGAAPVSVAVGDFNGDGKPDLATANSSSANVSVLLGTGTGAFQSAVNYAAGAAPVSVAVGDFNGDGKPDLAVANSNSDNVSVLLGTGTGTFQSAVNYAPGVEPISVAVGDFNGDGKPDLAVAYGASHNFSNGNVSVLLGTGTGTFQSAVNYAAGVEPRSVAVGDFNGDGKPDLATANVGSANVSVLQGTGTGTFQSAVNYAAGTGPIFVAVGDFNGDGKPDLAVANSISGNVSMLLGTGTGAFQSAVNYAAGSAPFSVAVGDFNGDGKPDLAVANVNNVSVLLNNSNSAPTDIALSSSSIAENQPSGTTVGTFSTTDPDAGDTFTYTLVSDTGSTDNASFTISGGTLKTAASFDFETKSSYSIRVRSTDAGGLSVEKVFTISVTDVNEAPTNIDLSSSSIAENQPSGTTVGSFSTTDTDTGDTFTYSLVSGTGSTDNASFTISGGTLKTAASFDFETKSSYSIRVRSADAGGLSVEKVFTISVTDVNEAPTVAVPAAQTAFEDVDKAIGGINVGDPEGNSLMVTLKVSHGTLTLGTTTGLTISGNGSGAVTLSGSITDLNTALAGLVYRGTLNYSGADTLSVAVSDGSLNTSGRVALTVKSAAQQSADLQGQVNALAAAGVLTGGQANSLDVKLVLQGNDGDIGRVQAFLNQVQAFLSAGVLTRAQADALSVPGNALLLGLEVEYRG